MRVASDCARGGIKWECALTGGLVTRVVSVEEKEDRREREEARVGFVLASRSLRSVKSSRVEGSNTDSSGSFWVRVVMRCGCWEAEWERILATKYD